MVNPIINYFDKILFGSCSVDLGELVPAQVRTSVFKVFDSGWRCLPGNSIRILRFKPGIYSQSSGFDLRKMKILS